MPKALTACAGESRTVNLSSVPQLIIVFGSPYYRTQITLLGFTKTSWPFTSSNITNSISPPLRITASRFYARLARQIVLGVMGSALDDPVTIQRRALIGASIQEDNHLFCTANPVHEKSHP